MRRIPTYTGTGEVSIRALNNRPPDTLGISRELLAASAAKLWGWGRNAWKIFETLASFLASLPLSLSISPDPSFIHQRVALFPSIFLSSRLNSSCFTSHAARSVFPGFGPVCRCEACPFRPLSSEPPAAAFRSQGASQPYGHCRSREAINGRRPCFPPDPKCSRC